MQISLLDEEVELILKAIKDNHWWIADHLRERIKDGKELEEKRANCEHDEDTYVGLKNCCGKCGAIWKIGQSETWVLLNVQKDKKLSKEILKAIDKIGLIGEVNKNENKS